MSIENQEKVYLPYQQRVVDERNVLSKNLEKLNAFIASPEFKSISMQEQARLRHQSLLMSDLRIVLTERIDNF